MRFASATRRSWPQRWRKPAHLIDGEWTSWYGARAIAGLRALAQFRAALA